jgi:hypothetical protein
VVGSRAEDLDAQAAASKQGVESEVEQRGVVAQILETEETDAFELGVVDPERVVVLVSVGTFADRGLDGRDCRTWAPMEGELVPRHELHQGVVVFPRWDRAA